MNEIISAFYHTELQLGYDYVYSINPTPTNEPNYKLHNHDDQYEIFLFIKGDANFHIEGNIYSSHPHALYITRPFEMHYNEFLSSATYERIVINIPIAFFKQHNCPELESVFLNRALGTHCQIPAHIVDQEMFDRILKINHYLQQGAFLIAQGVLLEFLYLLNTITEPLTCPTTEDERITQMLLYINAHLTDTLSLTDLADQFFINKHYLCRLFKKVTGYTVNHYINHKRLILVHDLHKQGQTLLEASLNAGFNSYAHFYKTHRTILGTSPKEGIFSNIKPKVI